MAESISCGKCNNAWEGKNTSHCGSCHETFSGITAFDIHQIGNDAKILCGHPTSKGLVKKEKPWGYVWACPPDPDMVRWWDK